MKIATREFVSYLRSLDIKLWADEGRLRYSAPKGAMTPVLRTQLKARKAELLSFLQQASALRDAAGTIVPVPRTEEMPLSFAQQRLWFVHYLEGGESDAYNIPYRRYLSGPVKIALLEESLAEMVRRHETLRTTFPMVNGEPVQLIAPTVKIELPVVDLRDLSEEEEMDEIERCNQWLNRPFDLVEGPLLRVALLRLKENTDLLMTVMHHIISDGWSIEIFIREWTTLYGWLEEIDDKSKVLRTNEVLSKVSGSKVSGISSGISKVPRTSSGIAKVSRTSAGISKVSRTSTGISKVPRTSTDISKVPRTSSGISKVSRTSTGISKVPRTSKGHGTEVNGTSTGISKVPRTSKGHGSQLNGTSTGISKVPRTSKGHGSQLNGSSNALSKVNGTSKGHGSEVVDGALLPAPVPFPLPELHIQYADFAYWQRQWLTGTVLQEELNYWTKQLEGAPPLLELPTDHARPPTQTGRGSTVFFEFSRDLTQKLKKLSETSHATLFMILLTGFVTMLSRHSGQENVVIGTLIANRNRSEIESLIGFFVNTLLLHIDLSGNPTFEELLRRVREVTLGAYAHQDMPFEELVKVLQPERNLSYNPLFQVMFIWQNIPSQQADSLFNPSSDVQIGQNEEKSSIIVSNFDEDSGTAMFDLFFTMWESDQQIMGSLTYNSDLFDADTIARMGGHLGIVLDAMVSHLQEPVMELPLLTEAERHQLLVEWNETEIEYPQDKCFHQLFEEMAAQSPEDVAVEFENEPFTYWQLNNRANQLAYWLIKQGIGPDTIVALLAYRNIDFLISMLAIFKAGGAYLPIDPLQPASRITRIFKQSEVPLVLSTLELAPLLVETLESCEPETWPKLLFIEDAASRQLGETWPSYKNKKAMQNPPLRNTPNDLAYVIYTSGSTGIPKGAMVEHKGMLNHLYAKVHDLKLTNTDIIAQNAPQSFDISVWQFLAGLLVGGQVNIFSDEAARDPTLLLKQVANQGITILEVVPSLLAMMLEVMPKVEPDLSQLRWLIPTGEALPPQLCRQWLTQYPHVPVINAYGPTECSDDVTHYPIYEPPAEEVFNIPIGRPINNTKLYILDSLLQPVPIGVAGELYVGGVGVGRGYLNDPERTEKAFMADPFALPEHSKTPSRQGAKQEFLLESGFGSFASLSPASLSSASLSVAPNEARLARLYKTGDKARYLPSGNIEFLGRLDYQVKIRGFRIELGEIEAALAQHPMVYQNAVVAREDQRKSKRLVAYVVPNDEPAPTVSDLRRFLKEKLPDYMVPAHFVTLDALPLTPNGKVNRRDLEKRPLMGSGLDEGFVAPRNLLEVELVKVWQALLDVRPIGIRDNFFDLGGHSLLAVRLMAQIEDRLGINLPLAALFQSSTIEELASHLDELQEEEQQQAFNSFSSLVPIQPAGTRAPFFAIHPIEGGVFPYMELSRHLGVEQPFYGIQAVGLNGEEEPLTRLEEMAAHYINAMQSVQPQGPYHLGGWSSGGVIAFEMAQQLQKAGHEVGLLALMDSYTSQDATPEEIETDMLTMMVQYLSELVDEEAPKSSQRVTGLTQEAQLKRLLDKAKKLNVLPPEMTSQKNPYLFKVLTANNHALTYYTPQPYRGRLTLLCASKVIINDPTRGWSRLAHGGLEMYQIPSKHEDMMQEPAVKLVAERLAACLSR